MGIIKSIGKKLTGSRDKSIVRSCPFANTYKNKPLMIGYGDYPKKFPEGIIIHFTAGHSNQRSSDAIDFALKMNHRYFFISESGEIVQQFCLTRYGSHAGTSKCPVTGRTGVSKYYVGIEVACEGKLTKSNQTSWGKIISSDRIRSGIINNKWQKESGSFETFTQAQEDALVKLCLWLCHNGTNPDLIFGHDEVAGDRKDDPGLSLSMSMDDFRKLIKARLTGG